MSTLVTTIMAGQIMNRCASALPKRELEIKGPVIIGDNVWIGDKVSILSGVTIGKGSVIACNAVVTKDVPSYSVVGGVPAKVIKQISPKLDLQGRQ